MVILFANPNNIKINVLNRIFDFLKTNTSYVKRLSERSIEFYFDDNALNCVVRNI